MDDAQSEVRVGWVDDPDAGWSAMVFEHPSGDTLEIQQDEELSDSDGVADGATYCLVRGGGPTHYGGLVSHTLVGGLLTLTLTAEAAAVLALPEAVELDLGQDEAERAESWLSALTT